MRSMILTHNTRQSARMTLDADQIAQVSGGDDCTCPQVRCEDGREADITVYSGSTPTSYDC